MCGSVLGILFSTSYGVVGSFGSHEAVRCGVKQVLKSEEFLLKYESQLFV